MTEAVIACERLVRVYAVDGLEVQALQGLDLTINSGELVALVGASGSGKSTLLNVLSGMDRPTAGRAVVAGYDLTSMTSRQSLEYRRGVVGFVWQQTSRNLLPYLTAIENVALPMRLAGKRRAARRGRADDLLALLDVGHCRDRTPDQLSGGEQQRVAIGVALANEPRVVFADEPTGELDTATGEQVFEALRTANSELGVTVMLVTHDAMVSTAVRRTIAIRDGRISTEVLRDGDGAEHEEYVVLDRAGRMQLPAEFVGALELQDRVRLRLEPDHVGVWPDRPARVDTPLDEGADR